MKKILLMIVLLFVNPCYANEKIIVLLDWFINPDHAPLFVAKEKGFFAQQGLDVELIGPSDPADPPKLVAAGKADIAITYQPQFVQQIDAGLPLAIIGTLIDKPLNCLVTLKNGPIHSIADLRGKPIGYSSGGMDNVTLKIMLQKYGMTLNDVIPINIHYDLTQALLSGKVAAVAGMMRNFEVTQMELVGYPARVFYPEQNGMPTHSELIFITQKQRAHDLRFKRFFIALRAGVEYLHKHPTETWGAFARAYPELNNELNHRAWLATLPYFAQQPATIDAKEFMQFATFMHKNGLIKSLQPLNKYEE